MAFGTKASLFKPAGFVRTEAGDETTASSGTVIERASKAAGLLEKHMAPYFFGNGGTIPFQSSANGFKGSRLVKHGFDGATFREG